MKIWQSFRGKLLLLVLLSLIPAVTLAVHRNLSLRKTEKARVTDSVSTMAKLIAAHEGGHIKNARQLLSTLGEISELNFLVRATNRAVVSLHFANLLKLSPDYLTFGLIETNGILFASGVNPSEEQVYLGDRSYFQKAISTREFSVGELQHGRITKADGINFGFPVIDEKGEVERVLFASLKLEVFGETARTVELPEGGTVLIVDRNGSVVARLPEMPERIGTEAGNTGLVKQLLQVRNGVFEGVGFDLEKRLYSVAPVSDGRHPCLFVAVGVPSKLLFQEANAALLKSLFFLAVVTAAVLSLAWIFADRRLVRPVGALASTAEQFAQANWSARAPSRNGTAELNVLADRLNEMAASLKRRDEALKEAHARIQEMNSELESKVRERTAQLTESNKELEAFSYSVSHDLRAPLRHMDGFAQLLQSSQAGKLDEKGRRYLEVISGSARTMGVLIDELLAFSRMGRKELQAQEFAMGKLVDEVVSEAMKTGEASNRKIEWLVAKLPEVKGDPNMLRLAWVNLIGNAVKYTGKVETARIEIGHKEHATEHCFFVKDNGAGFDMAYRDKLFGVFQRLHSDSEFEGVGIGLANVRRIVSRHGGRAWAEGEVGKGAAFYFTLPK